jgi:hypothetical protein
MRPFRSFAPVRYSLATILQVVGFLLALFSVNLVTRVTQPKAGLALCFVGIELAVTSIFLVNDLAAEASFLKTLKVGLIVGSSNLVIGIFTLVHSKVSPAGPDEWAEPASVRIAHIAYALGVGIISLVNLVAVSIWEARRRRR